MRSNILILVLIVAAFVLSLFDTYQGSYILANPLLAPAIIAGGSALVSGLANAFSGAHANEVNQSINRETREWQSGENRLNRQWEEYMWQKQNLYNSPKHLMELNKQAGLNPYLVGSVPSVGEAGSAGSPSMQSAPATMGVNPLDFSGIGNAGSAVANTMLQAKSIDANVSQQKQVALNQALQNAMFVGKNFNDWTSARNMYKTALQQYNGGNFDAENSPEMQMFNSQLRIAQADAASKELQLSLDKKYKPEQIQAFINKTNAETDNFKVLVSKYNAEIDLLNSNKNLTDAQIRESGQRLKNLQREFEEIGSRIAVNAAHEFSLTQSGNLSAAQAQTVDDTRQYLTKQLRLATESEDMKVQSQRAVFASESGVRKTLINSKSINNLKSFNKYFQPDINPVYSVLDGFTKSLNFSVGVHP